MEQVHLPHRAQLVAGRDLQRGRAGQDGVSIVTLAGLRLRPRRREGLQDALKKAKIVHEEYLPTNTTDFTAGIQRSVDALKGKPGRKVIEVVWAGGTPPINARRAGTRQALRHRAFHRRQHPAGDGLVQELPGHGRRHHYYFGIPKNPVNEWLVANHYTKFKEPADFFTAGGMAAGIAGGRDQEGRAAT